MNEFHYVVSERDRDTVTIWLNRPERLNVLSLELMTELTQAFRDAGDSDATGVILAAKGRLFSAGHDFTEMGSRPCGGAAPLWRVHVDDADHPIHPPARRSPSPRSRNGRWLPVGGHRRPSRRGRGGDLLYAGGKGGLFCTTPLVAVGRCIGRKRALEMAMTATRSMLRPPSSGDSSISSCQCRNSMQRRPR